MTLKPDPADATLSNAEIRKKYAGVLAPGRGASYAIDCGLSELAITEASGLIGRVVQHAMFSGDGRTLVLSLPGRRYAAIEIYRGYDGDAEVCFGRLKTDQLIEGFITDDLIASGLLSQDDIAAIGRERQEELDRKAKDRVASEKALYEKLKERYG